jgi:hypothetical protein
MSVDDFIKKIESENDWRQSDFAKIKKISTQLNSDLKIYFFKSSIPIVYAHLEGYIKSSLNSLVDFINELKLGYKSVSDTILVLAIENEIKSLSGNLSIEKKLKFIYSMKKVFADGSVKIEKSVINTKSNLNFDTLIDICKAFDLKYDTLTEYKKDLNKLVNIRNSIAHGENSYRFETIEDIQTYMELVENITEKFIYILKEYLDDKIYLDLKG